MLQPATHLIELQTYVPVEWFSTLTDKFSNQYLLNLPLIYFATIWTPLLSARYYRTLKKKLFIEGLKAQPTVLFKYMFIENDRQDRARDITWIIKS